MIPTLSQLSKRYDLPDNWLEDRPHLFSQATVPITSQQLASIHHLIDTIESVIQLPAYQEKVLSWAPEIAQKDAKVSGVFFGYDFHLTPDGPKLIEMNSNAGGAALSALLATAYGKPSLSLMETEKFVAMFQQEWQQAGRDQPLFCIAIVDEQPLEQYLYPEFLIFQSLFKQHGIEALIADPHELSFCDGKLCDKNGHKIDLVYNRLTDFSLSLSENHALKQAYLSDAIVLTPNPRSHALYADKRNLAVLSDLALLKNWGVSEEKLAILKKGIPSVCVVNPEQAEQLWQMRKQLFFKPVSGYGGKGTYRGSKLTRRVFDDILHSDYVAQSFIPPGEQVVEVEGEKQSFKVDIRSYQYQGKSLGMVARLYQGQVTNMRTKGGGFALTIES